VILSQAREVLPQGTRRADPENDLSVKFPGPGRFKALVIRSEQADPANEFGEHWHIFAIDTGDGSVGYSAYAPDGVFPAGAYRVYYLNDVAGSPFELQLPGGDGSGSVEATQPVSMELTDLKARQSQFPNTTVFGDSRVLTTRGATYDLISVEAPSDAVGRAEFCHPRGGDASSDETRYDIGCSGGGEFLGPGDATYDNFGQSDVPPGRYGVGVNATSFGLSPFAITTFAVWISFGPDGTAPNAALAPGPPPLPTLIHRRLASGDHRTVRAAFACSAKRACRAYVGFRAVPLRRITVEKGEKRTVRLKLPVRVRRSLRRHRTVRTTLLIRSIPTSGRIKVAEDRVVVRRR
jgi:hypothetical protein